MTSAPLPDDEAFRLQSLHALRVLDSDPEPEFDALVKAAALVCSTPISLISLIDAERQWFKASIGLDARETPREYAFCAHAILGDSLFEVPDAAQDTRFAANPFVTSAPDIRFYAGEPLRLRNGAHVGTLCVVDRRPRRLDEQQRNILHQLARAAEHALEGRRALLAERESTTMGRRAATLLRHSIDAIEGIDIEGRITLWNDAAERILGYTAAEALGQPLAMLMPPERQHEAQTVFERLRKSPGGIGYDTVRRRKDGALVSVSASVIPEFDGAGRVTGAVKFLRDIGERERAARQLADSETRFRTLADFSPHGVYYTDANGACTYTNPRWQQIYGLSLAESLGEGWAKTLHPDDRAAIYAEWQRTAAQRIEFDMKFRVQRTDGSVRYVHSRARPIVDAANTITGFVGSVVDVTAEQRAERELQVERQRLTNIIEGTNVGTWAWNVQTGEVQFNEQWAQLIGYALHELQPVSFQTWLDHADPADTRRVDAMLQQHFRGETERYECEFRMRHRDDQWRWMLGRGRVLSWTADGKPEWMFGTNQDITARKQQEQALQMERQHLANIIEGTQAGTWEWNVQTGATRFNEQWARIIGYELSELEPVSIETWMKFAHPDDLAASNAFLQQHFSGATPAYEFEARMRHRDGRWIWVLDRGTVMTWTDDGKPEWMFGTHQEITQRKLQEEALRKSRELLNRTGVIAGVGGWEVDLIANEIRWSDVTCRIHGVEPGYRPQMDEAINFYAPEARPHVQAAIEQAIAQDKPFDFELPFIPRNGQRIWVRAVGSVEFENGKAVRLIGAFQDVTERRQAAAALEASQRQYRLLYETAPAMLVSTDAEGRVLTATDRWLAHAGYKREEAIGQAAVNFLADGSRERALNELIPEFLRTGRATDVPLQMHRADGSTYDVLLSAVLERKADGKFERALIIMEDITEFQLRSAELQREHAARVQIEQRAKELRDLLNERSEMLNVLAHEVRQPLNNALAALQSATGVLSERSERSERSVNERLERARTVMSQVLAGVDNTLAAAALLASNMPAGRADTDIDTWIAVTVADIAVAERMRLSVVRETAARTVSMDIGLMRLALRNLLSNALRLAPRDSAVTVRLLDSDAPLALLIDVEDNGPGIPAEIRARLFERGASSRSGGHGLGLYIVRRVMELHGGSVQVVRSDERGTVMRLVLKQE